MLLPYSEDRTEVLDPYFRVEVRGAELPEHLIVLEASFEEEEGKRATATLRVLDRTGTFFADPFVKRRDLVKMWFGYLNESQPRGPFRVREVRSRFHGPEIEIEIELGELGDGFRGQVRCRTFTNGKLGDVLERVAVGAGLRWDPERLDTQILQTPVTADRAWVQNNESDGAFMRRIAEAHGLRLTIADGRVAAAPPSARRNAEPMLLKYYCEDASMKNVEVVSKARRPPSTRRDRSEEPETPQMCLIEDLHLGEDFSGFGPGDGSEFESLNLSGLLGSGLESLGIDLGDVPGAESAREFISSVTSSEPVRAITSRVDGLIDSAMGSVPGLEAVPMDSSLSTIPVVDLGRAFSGDPAETAEAGFSPDPAFMVGRMTLPPETITQNVAFMDRHGEMRFEQRTTTVPGDQEREVPRERRSPNWDDPPNRVTPGRAEGGNADELTGTEADRTAAIRASRGSTSYTISFGMAYGCIRIRPRMPVVVQGLGSILSGSGYRVTRVSLRYDTSGGFDTDVEIQRTLPFIVEGGQAQDRNRRREREGRDENEAELNDRGEARFSPWRDGNEDGDPNDGGSTQFSSRIRFDRDALNDTIWRVEE
jgi:phage protein D